MRILLASLIVAIGASSCFANCEAGGYTIHTTATYKPTDKKKIFLLYELKEANRIFAQLNGIDGSEVVELMASGKAPLTVRLGSSSCVVKDGWQIDPNYKSDDPYSSEFPYRIPLNSCSHIQARIPKAGYLLFDAVHHVITLPAELAIEPGANLSEDLTAKIFKDLNSRELYLLTFPQWGSNGVEDRKGRVASEMILGRTIQSTQVGRGASVFKIVIVSLSLKGVSQTYPKEMLPDQLKDNPNAPIEFPVIYFVPQSQVPRFIGDGSACSYVKLQQDQGNASFDRFRVTKAFDLNLDGAADLLEINGSFTYWITTTGDPLVIHYGSGC